MAVEVVEEEVHVVDAVVVEMSAVYVASVKVAAVVVEAPVARTVELDGPLIASATCSRYRSRFAWI
jgi:hypothetical protein